MRRLELIAKKHYAALPYHNFEHALWVRRQARKYMRRCKKYKIPYKGDVIETAALFHDAGYDKVKNSKEAYSCKIARRELKKLKYLPGFIQQVEQTIMATKAGYPLKTTEQKIIRAADLSSFTANYRDFLVGSKKIVKEYKILYHGKQFPVKKWAKLIRVYLRQRVQLTPQYSRDNFDVKAERNIARFLREYQ
ncbi:MAG: HD domain-containing protein [Candidatus Komeilibacteria bacterium]